MKQLPWSSIQYLQSLRAWHLGRYEEIWGDILWGDTGRRGDMGNCVGCVLLFADVRMVLPAARLVTGTLRLHHLCGKCGKGKGEAACATHGARDQQRALVEGVHGVGGALGVHRECTLCGPVHHLQALFAAAVCATHGTRGASAHTV